MARQLQFGGSRLRAPYHCHATCRTIIGSRFGVPFTAESLQRLRFCIATGNIATTSSALAPAARCTNGSEFGGTRLRRGNESFESGGLLRLVSRPSRAHSRSTLPAASSIGSHASSLVTRAFQESGKLQNRH